MGSRAARTVVRGRIDGGCSCLTASVDSDGRLSIMSDGELVVWLAVADVIKKDVPEGKLFHLTDGIMAGVKTLTWRFRDDVFRIDSYDRPELWIEIDGSELAQLS